MMPRDAGYPDPSSPRRPRVIAGRIGAALAAESRPPALASAPDANSLLRALKRRWLTAFVLAIPLATFVGWVIYNAMAPEHSAFTILRFSATRPELMTDKNGDRHEFNTYLKSQTGQMRSRMVLAAALNRDDVKKLQLEQQYPDPIAMIEERLKVDLQPDNELVKIYLSGMTPEMAMILVQAITDAFLEEVVEKDRKQRVDTVATLESMYNSQAAKLRTKKENARKLADELQTPDSELARLKHQQSLSNLNEAKRMHSEAKYRVIGQEQRMATHVAQAKVLLEAPVSEYAVTEIIEGDPGMQTLKSREAYLDGVLKDYNRTVPDRNNPVRQRAERELQETRQRIADRRKQLEGLMGDQGKRRAAADFDGKLSLMKAEYGTMKASELALGSEVERLTKETTLFGQKTAEAELLEKEIARDDRLVNEIGGNLEKQRLGLQANARVTKYQQAVLLPRDTKKQYLATGIGSVSVVLLVCMTVSWFEFRRRRIQSPDELSTGLGINVVGAVPSTSNADRLVRATEEEALKSQPLFESVDALRTLLLHNANQEATRLLMVTSADYGEGKTTLAAHLASSLARAGRKTLLLDADLRQPSVHGLFELPLQPGFSEILMGEVDTPDSLQSTSLEGLWVMTAGQWDREVIQCLARDGVQGIMEKLKEEFDFVVIDSPPILPSNDALLVGQNADAVLLAVRSGISQTPKVYAASQRLSSLGINVLGAVVNGMDPSQILDNNLSLAAA